MRDAIQCEIVTMVLLTWGAMAGLAQNTPGERVPVLVELFTSEAVVRALHRVGTVQGWFKGRWCCD